MDKIVIEALKCSKHSNKQLQFIQVNELLSNPNQQKPLFYCSSCFNHDLSFQATNYLMIDQIISEAHNSIIPKWPPVNDHQIIQDLFEFTQNQSKEDYEKQITDFFDQLKKEFSDKIDIIQKKMINEAQNSPTDSQKINRFTLIAHKSLTYFNIKLVPTKLNNGLSDLSIKQREDGEYEIEKLNSIFWVNCISSINLEKDVKYVFRFKVESIKEGEAFMIGLMRNANANSNYGYSDYLSCYLLNQNNCFINRNEHGIQNQLKGNGQFSISRDKVIELRVWLKEQILEVLDYPGYEYKIALDNQYKQKLTQYDDLRLYIGVAYQKIKIILKDAQIVKEFIN